MASIFVAEAARLERTLQSGDLVRGRELSRAVSAACIGCHTRSPRFATHMPQPPAVDLARLQLPDRVDLLIATHRLPEARGAIDRLLAKDSFAEENPAGWQRAVTRALVLEVRSAQSPDGALALVERVLNAPVPDARVWDDAESWRKSLLAWKREAAPPARTAAELLTEAGRLVAEAERTPRAVGDHGADVLHLRATAAAHEALARGLSGADVAAAHALLGVSYARLRDLHLPSLARLHDEACVRSAPHTGLAQGCLVRLELAFAEELPRGKDGKLGPADQATLAELRRLAGPAPAPSGTQAKPR